ncbi:MAG: cache domain-containing protein, partial [Pseudomonadota bacterium]
MIQWPKIPLRTMLVAGFLLTSAGPLVGFWYWSHTTVLKNEFDEVQERHLLLARNLGSALERYHGDLLSVFEIFTRKMARGDDLSFAEPLFQKLRFRHVCIFDAETLALRRSYFFELHACPNRLPEDRSAFLRDLAGNSLEGIGLSHVMRTPDGATVMYIAARVRDGLVIGAVHTSYFRELGRRISFGRLGHAAIVDHTGRVLAH